MGHLASNRTYANFTLYLPIFWLSCDTVSHGLKYGSSSNYFLSFEDGSLFLIFYQAYSTTEDNKSGVDSEGTETCVSWI